MGRPEIDRPPEKKFRLSDVKPFLRARSFRPRRSLGQNFLGDPNSLRFISEAAEAGPRDSILEVGTGPGLLTQYLAEVAAAVYSVEVDPVLHEVASELLAPLANVHLIQGDILAGKQEVDRAILERIPTPREAGGSIVHVSNLPYSTAVPILVGLLEEEPRIRRMVVTVQEEIGDRLLSGPGRRSFGVFTVLVHLQAEVEPLKSLPPQVFWPRPEVRSTVIRVRRKDPPPALPDYGAFKGFLRGLFTLRRKSLMRGLRMNPASPAAAADARAALASVGVEPERRVEELDPRVVLDLFRALRKRMGSEGPVP